VPLNLIACSVPVSVTDYSSYTFVDTRISPAAILYLADHACADPPFVPMLYGVRPFQGASETELMVLYIRFRAHTDASRNGLSRFHVPFIGQLAERWLDEE
jgi:hypothetical protein